MKFYFLFSYKFIIIHLIFTYKIKKIIILKNIFFYFHNKNLFFNKFNVFKF